MKPKGVTLPVILLLVTLVIANCTAVENLPSDISQKATDIASTVEAGVDTVQTILTPPAQTTPPAQALTQLAVPPEATPESLMIVCVPPLDMTELLTELTLADGRKLVVTNGWLSLFNADGTIQTTLLVPAERDTPLADLGVSIETFRCEPVNLVYYNPDTVK
jgi:hypothetical protein